MCLSNLQLDPFAPLFFDFLLGFSASSTCRKNMFCHICILFVKCSSDTREDTCDHTTDCTISPLTWDFIPVVKRFAILFVRWFSLSVFGCLRIWCRRGRPLFLFMKFAPVTRSSNSMMETTRVSFRTLSSCLPLPAISHFPFNVGFIILSTPCHYSSMNHIVSGFWGSDFSSSGQKTISLMFLILNNLFVFCFARFLDHTEPTQSVTEQNPLILTSTILPGPYPKVVHLLIIVPDTIWHRKSWTSSFWETFSE